MRATRVSSFDKLIWSLRVCASPHWVTGRRVPGADGAIRNARYRIALIATVDAMIPAVGVPAQIPAGAIVDDGFDSSARILTRTSDRN